MNNYLITEKQVVYLSNLKYIRYGTSSNILKLRKLSKKQASFYISKLTQEIKNIEHNLLIGKISNKDLNKALKVIVRNLVKRIQLNKMSFQKGKQIINALRAINDLETI
jgi:hypothetical protein